MKITIKKDVFKKFPKLKVAFLHVKNFDNKSKHKEAKHILGDIEQLIKLTFHKDNMKNHYLISPWSVAQAEFGKKAIHYHTSVERLLHSVLKGRKVYANDTLTTLLRYISLRYLIPSGIDDFYKISGDINFAVSKGKEKVSVLKSLKKGALFYKDSRKILGTKLDYWKNKKTSLSKDTTQALIHFDSLPPIDSKKLTEIIKETKDVIETFCGGEVELFVLDKKKNSVKI